MAVATAPQAAVTTREPKGWLATVVVALVMVGIVGGGFVAQNSVVNAPPIGIKVGVNIHVYPTLGWEFAGRSDDQETVLITNGSGSLAVTAFHKSDIELLGGRGDQLDRKRAEWIATGTVTASEPEAVTVGPYSARRFHYTGTFPDVPIPVEGEVTRIENATDGALFDGWAGIGQYATVKDDVDAMISSTR